MDIVAGSFLSSLFQVLFDRMASIDFSNFFRKRKYHMDDHLMGKLNTNLRLLRAVLHDAESKRKVSKTVQEWLDELQDAIYQVEDLLDQINTEALRVKVENEYQSPANQVSASTQTSSLSNEFLKEIMPRIQEMVDLSDKFVEQTHAMGLVKWEESREKPFRLPSTSLVDETDVYGRDAEKDKLIQELLSDGSNGNNFTVISVFGPGGVGKTTLAQFVYNDARMNEHFDTKAWVCVSEEYDAIRITKDVLRKLNILSSGSDESFDSLQTMLKEGLSGKKFLLVLDDVWNENYKDWSDLSIPFKAGKVGSKIIVTTRNENVASMMGDQQHIHRLNLMAEDDCWFLFEKHAFNGRDPATKLEFESIGKDIVRKCKGLPLAVKTIAGVLRSKETVEDWNEILRNDEWDNRNNPTGILPSLRLSYSCLPSQLKSCFAYCALFHKDYEFDKDEVILLWMAHDLLENPKSNQSPKDIGEEFFRELRCRSLFQQSSNGKFSMHDLVNDLAKLVAGKYFLRLEDHGQQGDSLSGVRHFSYLSTWTDAFQKFKSLNDMKFLRTFLPIDSSGGAYRKGISKKLLNDILPTFKSLRVLSLSGYVITELPIVFKNLKRLRFLNLSCTDIEKLPDWICTLCNLQILLLVGCSRLKEFPKDMNKLVNLCHLDVSGCSRLKEFPKDMNKLVNLYHLDVSGCSRLKEFPKDMNKLVNLCHLDVSGTELTELPMQIERLASLQFLALSTFIVSIDGGSRIEDLGRLRNLHGELAISGLQNVVNDKDASTAQMKDKNHIKTLKLIWRGDVNNLGVAHDVLENLQPHFNIEKIEIEGYCGMKFPDWFGNPLFCHMTSLSLSKCVHCRSLPALGQLPCLESLTVDGFDNVERMGQEIYGDFDKPFSCLKVMKIQNMQKWREWYIPENGVFSCLEKVKIVDCPQLIGELLKQLPSSLRIFEVSECPGLVNSQGQMTIFDIDANLHQRFCSLRKLKISGMPKLNEISSSDLKTLLPSLEKLVVIGCSDIWPFPISGLPHGLKQLTIEECGKLKLETGGIAGSCHESLKTSSPSNTEGLSIAQGNQNLTSLEDPDIFNCDQFYAFPDGGFSFPNLTIFSIRKCLNLKSLPERMHTLLPSLKSLALSYCPEIECFPEGGLPSGLEHLSITSCEKLVRQRRQWGLDRLCCLDYFNFRKTHEETLLEDLPLPCTLQYLILSDHYNVKELKYAVLQPLIALKALVLEGMPKLQSLPEERLPSSISELIIINCPLLKTRLEWERGEDWPKVAHIPRIKVDKELIP